MLAHRVSASRPMSTRTHTDFVLTVICCYMVIRPAVRLTKAGLSPLHFKVKFCTNYWWKIAEN